MCVCVCVCVCMNMGMLIFEMKVLRQRNFDTLLERVGMPNLGNPTKADFC